MGHEVEHYAMIPRHAILQHASRDPDGYGRHFWLLPGCTLAFLAQQRAMIAASGPDGPDELTFIADAEALCRAHPTLSTLSCTLDRQYEALSFVLQEHTRGRPRSALLHRACHGGDALTGLTSGTGWPYRWLEPSEVHRIAQALAELEADAFHRSFHRCHRDMYEAGVYKASPSDHLDARLAAAWHDQLWGFVVALRAFFATIAEQDLAALTATG